MQKVVFKVELFGSGRIEAIRIPVQVLLFELSPSQIFSFFFSKIVPPPAVLNEHPLRGFSSAELMSADVVRHQSVCPSVCHSTRPSINNLYKYLHISVLRDI